MAQAYLEQVRASPDCWRLCLARFEASQFLEVRFWCAQTLSSLARSSYAQLPPEARDQLKRALVAAGTQPGAAQLPSFLRNKIAQAVVAIAAHEYPDQWPSFFQASGTLQGGAERGRWASLHECCCLTGGHCRFQQSKCSGLLNMLCPWPGALLSSLPMPSCRHRRALMLFSAGPAGHAGPGRGCSGPVLQVAGSPGWQGRRRPRQLKLCTSVCT